MTWDCFPARYRQGHHPFAHADLRGKLHADQWYDVSVSLLLPRTPSNIAAGNFMVDVAFLGGNASSSSQKQEGGLSGERVLDGSVAAIARSRRAAMLTYTSPVVDLAQVVGALPLYTLGWKKQSEAIEVVMFEGLEFKRGLVPDRAQVVVEADEKMQFYSASIRIHAKFRGLRWILYNYRMLSFVVFTATFFGTSLASTLLIYLVFSFNASYKGKQDTRAIKKEIKMEPQEDSQGSKPELYVPAIADDASLDVRIKKEEYDSLEPADLLPLGGEADDEDTEDEAYDGNTSAWRDSGIGTGREDVRDSGGGSGGKKRRSYNS